MIKYDNDSIEVRGNTLDILTELGMLTEHIIAMMQKYFPRDVVVGVVKKAINTGIELSGQKDMELSRMHEVAEILRKIQEEK